MRKLRSFYVMAILLVLFVLPHLLTSCAKQRTPAEEVLYSGGLVVNNEGKTYPASGKVAEAYGQVKECMGLKSVEIPEPILIAKQGGNSVACGTNEDGTPRLKDGCYYRNDVGDGVIVVPQGATIDIVKHEIVHHVLYETTGDLDATHKSEFFLTCGSLTIIEDGT